MPSNQRPNPSMFKHRRVNAVPAAPGVSRQPVHAFRGNVVPRGNRKLSALVDSGIFFSLGAAVNINAVALFHSLYDSRAATTDAIRDEVRTNALKGKPDKPDLRPAATLARNYFINSGRVAIHVVEASQSFAASLQLILAQLRNHEAARSALSGFQGASSLQKHAGEATLIALALTQNNVVILTNDSGASFVAGAQQPSIPSLHFADVLKELVCDSRGGITAAAAAAAFDLACAVSDITSSAKPADATAFLTCAFDDVGQRCSACDVS
ncbi:hypothetical protein [Micromonospora cremea]|nr:hypothetical protein [Micromonospora cremea]